MKRFIAFTLAETLIVMGVIGIVSALTLPNLNSSTGDKEKVAKVKKIYQNLNDAFGRAVAVYGPFDEWFINDADATAKAKRIGERMTEFMKISKNCAQLESKGCFASGKYKASNGEEVQEWDKDTTSYKVITADGTSIAFTYDNEDYSRIYVDIDGPNKGMKTNGKDFFVFAIYDNVGAMPFDYLSSFNVILEMIHAKGDTAATWIINYDNMDYLKLDSRNRCPNGTTITEANPRCK